MRPADYSPVAKEEACGASKAPKTYCGGVKLEGKDTKQAQGMRLVRSWVPFDSARTSREEKFGRTHEGIA